MKPEQPPRSARVALLGAMFLMATSAIGPGFITQTTQFTAQLGAAFAFAILVSVLVDVAIQLNVWRVIGVSGMRAPELGNRVAPGLGHALALIIALGGLDWEWTWVVLVLYFTCIHSTLVLFGMYGLIKAMSGQVWRFPLIGPPLE